MATMEEILEGLNSEADAEIDIQQGLAKIQSLLEREGDAEREVFSRRNGLGIVLQFYGDAYAVECSQVLKAYLDVSSSFVWPDRVIQRIQESIFLEQNSPQLKEVSVGLLLHGARMNSEIHDSLFTGGKESCSAIERLLDHFALTPLLSWTERSFACWIELLNMYANQGGEGVLLRGMEWLWCTLKKTEVQTIHSQHILEARMMKTGDERVKRDEELLQRYSCIVQSLRSRMEKAPKMRSCLLEKGDGLCASAILEEVRALLKSSPMRVHRVLDWNGKLKAFETRSFSLTDQKGASLLGEWVMVIGKLVSDKETARSFFQSNLMEWMEELSKLSEPSLRECLVALYGQLTRYCKAALNEVVEEKNLFGLCGFLSTDCDRLISQGLKSIAAEVDGISGDGYTWFESSSCGLRRVFELYGVPSNDSSELKVACKEVILRSLERSRRMYDTRESQLPPLDVWKSFSDVLSDLSPLQPPPATADNPRTPVKYTRRESRSGAMESVRSEKHRVEECDEDGLRVVFDNGPSSAVRANRNLWKQIPLHEKIRWTQTTEDILIWITLPKGTRAKHLSVLIEPLRLCLKLDWFGRVVDGPLHRRCKASEALWVLEDAELHLTIPKDDLHFWKALFEGGIEKSYLELLQESVDSDEPMTSYDDMDSRSKELIDDIRERQQMVQEGMIDLEGFDDFRIVVGEHSL